MQTRAMEEEGQKTTAGRRDPVVGISLPPPPPAALPGLGGSSPGEAVRLRRTSSEPERQRQNASKPATSRGAVVPSSRQVQHQFQEQQQRHQPSPSRGLQRTSQESYTFEGVLYKRRDVFKKRWRPRYFILNTQSGVLTYYLLTNEADGTAPNPPFDSSSKSPFSSPLRRGSGNEQSVGGMTAEDDDHGVGSPSSIGASRQFPSASSLPTVGASNLAASGTAQTSKQPLYDVVPRGTIYLPGCAVRSNGSVGSLHALKVTPSSKDGGGSVHLAAASSADRDLWVTRLRDACHIGASFPSPPLPNAMPPTTPEVGEQSRPPPAPVPAAHAAAGGDECSSISTTDSMAAEAAEAEAAVAAASLPSPSKPNEEPARVQPQSPTPTDAKKPPATWADQLDSSRCTSPSQSILRPYRPPSALDEEDSDEDDEDDEDNDEMPAQETSEQGDSESVLRGVPPALAAKIDSVLDTYLPLCDYNEESHSDPMCPWKLQWQKRGVKAFQYKPASSATTSAGYDARYPMLKSVAVLDFPANVVIDLLWDINQREAIEQLLSKAARLRNYNSHSAIDYFAYKPFWPSSGRDFFVANHWRELPRGDPPRRLSSQQRPGSLSARTYVLLSFSIIDDSVCPQKSDHVRANLLVSLYVLSAMPGQDHRCRLVRIVSADLGGSIPSAVVGAIQQQAAFVPAVISDFLRNKGAPRARMASIDVSDMAAGEPGRQTPRRWSEGAPPRASTLSENSVTDYQAEEVESVDAPHADTAPSVESLGSAPPLSPPKPRESEVPSVVMSAFVLALPLVARKMSRVLFLDKEVAFVAATVACIRFLALHRLGSSHSVSILEPQHGQVTCRFNVDLKGVLRFLGLRKEEREEKQVQRQQNTAQGQSTAADSEISVTHIVVKAVARALSEFAILNCRRVKAPVIAIDGYYGFDSVDITVASGAGASENASAVTLRHADRCSVQTIANMLMEERSAATERRNRRWESSILERVKHFVSVELPGWFGLEPAGNESVQRFGSCVVFTSPDSEHSEVDIDVSPAPVPLVGWKVGGGSPVVTVVVGGVRVMRDARTSAASPVLSMSITIDCPVCDIATCRKFAERVQRYLQFPEVCDGAT